ncbi:aspartyl/asparaginyl beta-hydroxylase domain-containing protein [Caballeronia sp. HLA56]
MNSRIIGKSHFIMAPCELNAALAFTDDNKHYSEFHFGDWKSFVIWNQTGSDDDGVVLERGSSVRPTSRGNLLPALNDWISATFDTSLLRLARIHSLGDGVLVPHRDFVEFAAAPWTRVHVPLLTNRICLHSDGDTVFRMRPDEIWFLDASNLHSAINYSAGRRLNLCLDFDLDKLPIESVFNAGAGSTGHVVNRPEVVQRMPLGDSFQEELRSLAATLTLANFHQAVGLLSKVHFFRQAHIAEFFEWLPYVAEHSRDASLRSKADRYVRFLRDKRSVGERFTLQDEVQNGLDA